MNRSLSFVFLTDVLSKKTAICDVGDKKILLSFFCFLNLESLHKTFGEGNESGKVTERGEKEESKRERRKRKRDLLPQRNGRLSKKLLFLIVLYFIIPGMPLGSYLGLHCEYLPLLETLKYRSGRFSHKCVGLTEIFLLPKHFWQFFKRQCHVVTLH